MDFIESSQKYAENIIRKSSCNTTLNDKSLRICVINQSMQIK